MLRPQGPHNEELLTLLREIEKAKGKMINIRWYETKMTNILEEAGRLLNPERKVITGSEDTQRDHPPPMRCGCMNGPRLRRQCRERATGWTNPPRCFDCTFLLEGVCGCDCFGCMDQSEAAATATPGKPSAQPQKLTHTHTRAPTPLKSSNLGKQPLHREAPFGPIHPTYTLPPPYHTTKGRPRALQSGGARGTGMPYPPGNTKPRLHRKGYDFRPPYLRRHRRESRLRLRLRLPPRRQG